MVTMLGFGGVTRRGVRSEIDMTPPNDWVVTTVRTRRNWFRYIPPGDGPGKIRRRVRPDNRMRVEAMTADPPSDCWWAESCREKLL